MANRDLRLDAFPFMKTEDARHAATCLSRAFLPPEPGKMLYD
jgi:hypothetical protein